MDKDSIIKSLNELTDKTISDIDAIMRAIKDCGMDVPDDMPILRYADLIRGIPHKYVEDADVTTPNVLANKVAYGRDGRLIGTMPNRGAVSATLPVNGSYTIPAGYHNGAGVVSQSGVDDTGINTDDATMSAAQVLAGYTGYARGTKVTGTMPYYGVTQYNLPVNGTFWIAEGYHPAGGYITQSGVQVGTDTSDATLIDGNQIISGYTAYARGNKVTGTMPYHGVTQYNLPVNGTYYIPAGYHPAGGYITQSGVQPLVTASGTAPISGNGTLTITTGLNKVYCVLLKGNEAYGVIAPSTYSGDNSYTLAVASRYAPTGYSDQIGYCAWNGFPGPTTTTFSITNKKLYDAFKGVTAGAGASTSWVAYGY